MKNVTYRLEHQTAQLAASGGVMLGGAADGRPAIDTDAKMAEAILTFSGTTNGELAVQGFEPWSNAPVCTSPTSPRV